MMPHPLLWDCNTHRTCRWFITGHAGSHPQTTIRPRPDAVALPIELNPDRRTASIGRLQLADSRLQPHRSVVTASWPAAKSP
jgi:hypothetical protein